MSRLLKLLCMMMALFMMTNCKTQYGKCQNTNSFSFYPVSPRKQSLQFCKQYNQNTCCSPSDSYTIYKDIKPLFEDENVPLECKKMTMDIWCSSCNPKIGTNELNGICIVKYL